jgi:hypothetical protein
VVGPVLLGWFIVSSFPAATGQAGGGTERPEAGPYPCCWDATVTRWPIASVPVEAEGGHATAASLRSTQPGLLHNRQSSGGALPACVGAHNGRNPYGAGDAAGALVASCDQGKYGGVDVDGSDRGPG